MQNHKIILENLPWMEPAPGCRSKSFVHGTQRIRLLEFREGFIEPDWCAKGHAGIVMEGAFSLDFDGRLERFIKGDIVYIPQGEADRHKAVLGKGEKVTLLLFENIEQVL